MKNFLGIFGAVLFGFGLLSLFFLGFSLSYPLVTGHLVLGFVLLLYWLFTSGLKNLSESSASGVGRTARFGLTAALSIGLFFAVLSAVYWIAKRNNVRFDLTQEGVYSLSQQSTGIVSLLKKPLKLVAFKGQETVDDAALEDLFNLYKVANPGKITSDIIDPRTKPFLVEKYEMKQGNVVYLQYGEDSDEKKSVSRINEASEEAVTNSIIKLTRGESKKIYVVEGHGEPRLADTSQQGLKAFADAIKDENLTVEGIFLGEKSAIPDDAAALLLISPKNVLPPQERDLITKYAEAGGRLILFTDPQRPSDVREIAAKFGVTVGDDVVVDLVQRLFGPVALGAQIVARDYGMHPVTRNLTEESVSIFTIASSVSIPEQDAHPGDSTSYVSLVKSGKNSWAERDLAKLFNPEEPSAEFNEGADLKGPVSVAAAYEKKLSPPTAESEKKDEPNFEKVTRVVVFGDSDFILNESLASYANRDLVLNAINWSVGEEGGLSIRPRSIKSSMAPITRDQLLGILTSSLLIPEVLLLFGLFVWWRRRSVVQ